MLISISNINSLNQLDNWPVYDVVQPHNVNQEIERQSIRSSLSGSGGAKTQAKTAQHLQRQSTPNASRRYYYGNAATANAGAGKTTGSRRRNSVTSSSSSSSLSSLDDPRAKQRQQGARSRDSGFRSPHSIARTETPLSDKKRQEQQIYSVSTKAKSKHGGGDRDRDYGGATSPTLTTGSAGQRSVKTTTTTVSAGLAERPLSRNGGGGRSATKSERGRAEKVSSNTNKPPSPFEKLANFFMAPGGKSKSTTEKGGGQRQRVSSR